MIFVAVGTTDFDLLTEKMDHIANDFKKEVVIQIGNGRYIPRYADYFRFAPSLDEYYRRSDIVVSHGGLGIITEALELKKKLICVENTDAKDRHQRQLLRILATDNNIIWCHSLDDLPNAVDRVSRTNLKPYDPAQCWIHNTIEEFLVDSRSR